jgi:spore maturation protein CgeB
MKTNPSNRLLILDGIGGVPLGREVTAACQAHGIDTVYQDCAELPAIPAYGLRAAFAKALNKHERHDSFFFLAKLAKRTVSALMTKHRPSRVLVIGFIYKHIDPALLAMLKRKLGFSLHLYDTDSCNLYERKREFVFFIENELPIYDNILSFSSVTTRFFHDSLGLPAHYFPFGAQPIDMPPTSGKSLEVLFVGSSDLRRVFLLEHIRDHVSIFGDRWTRNAALMSPALQKRVQDRQVWGKELHQLFADTRIVLNITRSPFHGAETGINLRIFEALAANTFLLTDHCDEIGELFTPSVELDTFHGSAELVEKVAWYLANPMARAEIARRGHERFLAEFTWEKRCAELLRRLGYSLSSDGIPA